MLKIAYFVNGFPLASETFIVNQIAGMAARGHATDIFTTGSVPTRAVPAVVERLGLMQRAHCLVGSRRRFVRVLKLAGLMLVHGWRAPALVRRALGAARRSGREGSLRLLYAVLTLIRLRARRYDVIHAQFGTLAPLALRLIDIGVLEGPLVVSFRGYDLGTDMRRRYAAAYKEVFGRGSLFLPVSQSLARRLEDAGCDPAKIRVHHSGVECSKIPFMERVRPQNAPVKIISIGRLVEKKGIRYSIEAVARAIAAGRSVEYVVVGDGPLRTELECLAQQLGCRNQVTFVGWKPHAEALQLAAAAHLLVAPSVTAGHGDEEGIPNVVKEAMAMGLPVVSTIHGGIPELVEDGVSGFLVPERNVDALYERIVHLIDHPQLWSNMGRAGRQRIEAEYDIDKLSDDLAELYSFHAGAGNGAVSWKPDGHVQSHNSIG